MKINGSSGNSINFIEQKKSNISSSNKQENINFDHSDKFTGKSVSPNLIMESNQFLGILEIAHESISKLGSDAEELKKLSEKFVYFKSQKNELTSQFYTITEGMLDVVDNTIYKDTQIFYTILNFTVGSYSADLSLSREFNIEDFNINSLEELSDFENTLNNIKEEIKDIKKYIQVASFNKIAALHVDSPHLNNAIPEKISLALEDIKGAHDVSSLKDKVSTLLAE